MEPTYREGMHVLTFNWSKLKKNDVIVFEYKKIYLIKRIKNIARNTIITSADNKFDNLKILPISKDKIVGKVIFVY